MLNSYKIVPHLIHKVTINRNQFEIIMKVKQFTVNNNDNKDQFSNSKFLAQLVFKSSVEIFNAQHSHIILVLSPFKKILAKAYSVSRTFKSHRTKSKAERVFCILYYQSNRLWTFKYQSRVYCREVNSSNL